MADTIKTNLGPVTAYADAKAHGYTGTREEFGDLLANAGLNLKAAETAKADAETAKQAAETAQQAAAENQKNTETQAANAKASADTAAEQAAVAKESATDAANSATAAQESETNAGLSATAAANAEAVAKQSQNAAETAKADAETAKTAAGNSADAAANSAADAKKTLESIPADYSTLSGKVGENANRISKLKEDLGELDSRLSESIVEIDDNIFSKKEKVTDVSLVDSRTKVSSTSAIPYKTVNATAISFANATGYDSYWFIVDKDADIYTKESDSMYYAFVHGVQYKGILDNGWVLCEQSTRYRKSDGNLPTEDSKLHVSKGDVLAFTFPKDKSGYIYSLEYTKEVSAIFANKVFANNLFDVTVSENEISITLEKTKYYLRHVVSSVTNVDCWRIYKGSLIDNGVEYVMWEGSDADGVIKLVGEEDFLGGFHGDEITKSVKCIIDGKEVDISTPSEFHCKSFQLYCDSDIYHCNTSADASRICFERTKSLRFAITRWL